MKNDFDNNTNVKILQIVIFSGYLFQNTDAYNVLLVPGFNLLVTVRLSCERTVNCSHERAVENLYSKFSI